MKGATFLEEFVGVGAQLISIHAPVKGATSAGVMLFQQADISIHAPVKGATDDRCGMPGTDEISIHAPVKGATHVAIDRP